MMVDVVGVGGIAVVFLAAIWFVVEARRAEATLDQPRLDRAYIRVVAVIVTAWLLATVLSR